VRNFFPVFVSRGVVQLSAYIDTLLASLLPTGAVTGLANAQLLYTLPVSLFGMSVSAAELPAMSGALADDDSGRAAVRRRLESGLRQIAFFVTPSAMAFFALGDVLTAALFQTGRFGRGDAVYVWGILAGSSVGLLASTLGRLYASACYAFGDTRTPLRAALIRVALTTVLGYVAAIHVPLWLGLPASWGAAGLTASAGLAGWVEMLLLRRTVASFLGPTALPGAFLAQLWFAAGAAAGVAWLMKLVLPHLHPAGAAVLILVPYGTVFLTIAALFRMPEMDAAMRRLGRS
jgi:putative peptidoglycan lipid II flippase